LSCTCRSFVERPIMHALHPHVHGPVGVFLGLRRPGASSEAVAAANCRAVALAI
jgi:hypothetical protein